MSKMRLSLVYLAAYLLVIGIGLLFAPRWTLALLQSNADYGDVFPRLAGMLMSGLGITVVGMIRGNTAALYPATLAIRVYFGVCLAVFYAISADPVFLVVLGIVALGFVLTLSGYLADRRQAS